MALMLRFHVYLVVILISRRLGLFGTVHSVQYNELLIIKFASFP
jgi:hypothetical protein